MTTMAQMRERYAAIKAALPATQGEVATALGMSVQRVSDAFIVMKARRMVHICEWRPNPIRYAKPVAVYGAGPGKTAPVGMAYEQKFSRPQLPT